MRVDRTQTMEKDWTNRALNVGLWIVALAIAVLFLDSRNGGTLARSIRSRWSIDGRYVSSDLGLTSTVQIDDGRGSIDLRVARSKGMRVERRGDTVRFTGGTWYDVQGQVIPPEQWAVIARGDQVLQFNLVDDGQTLESRGNNGVVVRYVRQP